MLKEYAKLEDSRLEMLRAVPHITNPSDKQVAEYAMSHGYKELVRSVAPGTYYNKSYSEGTETITEEWTPWELDTAKSDALDRLQMKLDNALSTRVTIECIGFEDGIIYDQNALTNAMGLEPGDVFIDAKDGLHELTEENIVEIKKSLKSHRLGLYAATTEKRAVVAAAETVDEVEATLKAYLA